MLALLIYCYANGIFGSRRIERASYRDIGVRFIKANCHPDHDTICKFRREKLQAKLDAACKRLQQQAKERAASEQAEYERKVAARDKRSGRRKGKRIKPPKEEREEKEQSNLTDADSRLMRKNKHSEYQQCHNAQAVVDARCSQLVLGARVSQCGSDRADGLPAFSAERKRQGRY